jgi:hypothetical protein
VMVVMCVRGVLHRERRSRANGSTRELTALPSARIMAALRKINDERPIARAPTARRT